MSQEATFQIIGRIGKIDTKENITTVSVASNYPRKTESGFDDDTHWNFLKAFKANAERVNKASTGDLVLVKGRVRQTKYENDGKTTYGVDMIIDRFGVLANKE